MKVGDLVEIGWNGKTQKPFIGVVTTCSESAFENAYVGYILVNGKMQWANISKLTKVEIKEKENEMGSKKS